MNKKSFLKPMPVLIASLLASGALVNGSAAQAASLILKNESEQSSTSRDLILQPADQDSTVFLDHRSHASHSSHASHHSHYSGFVGE